MTNSWQIASDNFREDDGSLPSVAFDGLRPESVPTIYQYVVKNGQCVMRSPTLKEDSFLAALSLYLSEDGKTL